MGVKDCKFIILKSQSMELFHRRHSCGLEVKLETFIIGTLFVVRGMCPDRHMLCWQSKNTLKISIFKIWFYVYLDECYKEVYSQVKATYSQVIPQQLHDEGTVLVGVFL